MYFKQFILDFFNGLPELYVAIPSYIYDFLSDFINLCNYFVVFNDFSTFLAISVTYAFVNVSFAFANFVSNFKK